MDVAGGFRGCVKFESYLNAGSAWVCIMYRLLKVPKNDMWVGMENKDDVKQTAQQSSTDTSLALVSKPAGLNSMNTGDLAFRADRLAKSATKCGSDCCICLDCLGLCGSKRPVPDDCSKNACSFCTSCCYCTGNFFSFFDSAGICTCCAHEEKSQI